MAPPRPKPTTNFSFGAYMFSMQQAGSIREPILGLYIGDSTQSRYCGWFSNIQEHAVDWALIHNKPLKIDRFSGLHGDSRLTQYSVRDPITIDALVPKDNRTQIGVAQQRKSSMLVRFIISYNNDKDRHMFMVEYPGVAPKDMFGKVYWGKLWILGDTPFKVDYLFPHGQ